MQNLITLVGLASLANAASLVTTGNLQMAASQDKKRENHEEANDLEAGSFVLGGPLTGFKKNFCDPCKQDDVCEPRYLNTFCDFTIDNDANNLVYGATKTLVT